MASRVLTRSKALAHALSRADAAGPSPLYGARSLRALSTLPQNPAAAAAPSQRQTSGKRTSGLSGTQVFPRLFSAGASNGSSVQEMKESASTKVTAFSSLEATITKPRRSPLTSESLK